MNLSLGFSATNTGFTFPLICIDGLHIFPLHLKSVNPTLILSSFDFLAAFKLLLDNTANKDE